MEHPKLRSVKSLLDVSRILALIFLALNVLLGLWNLFLSYHYFGFTGFSAIFEFISAGVLFLIYTRIQEVIGLVNAGHFQQAKDTLLLWAVLGIIFGWVILGVLLIVAYMDFDTLIASQQQSAMGSGMPPGMASPQAWPGQVAPTPAPIASAPAPAAAPTAPTCPQCRQPATWIAQYGRWYCYTDRQYL